MMKKLVCLMMVALFGTVASAGIMFDGPTVMDIDSTITINIIADVVTQSGLNVGAISLDKGSATVGTLNPLFTAGNDPGKQKDGSVNGIYIFQVNGTVAAGDTIAAGEVLYSFTIDSTGLAYGDVITLNDWIGTNPFGGAPFPVATGFDNQNADLGSFAITVIPEPITVALLGLGGLFIRRRK